MQPQYQPTPQPPPNVSQPMQPPYASTTVIHQPVGVAMHVVPNNNFYDNAKSMFCPYCQSKIITDTTYENGGMTWLVSCIICCAGGAAGCCLIPFCVDMFKDVTHSCPNCHQELGVYKRL